MNKKEFYKRIDELTNETGFDLSKEQKRFAFVVADQYATSKTEALKKEIEELKVANLRMYNLLNPNEINFNKICNCIHKGKSTSMLCVGMCNR